MLPQMWRCWLLDQYQWNAVSCDRDLLLLDSNASITDCSSSSSGNQRSGSGSAAEAEGGMHGPQGILNHSLGALLPSGSAASSKGSGSAAALLPAEVVQQCEDADAQGRLLLGDMASTVMVGQWAVAAYAALLRGLLPSECSTLILEPFRALLSAACSGLLCSGRTQMT